MRTPIHQRHKSVALGLAAAGLLVAIAVSVISPPVPQFHDEFSKLLAADTFASGRLTNATHPLWKHFESFHIIQQPSYSSKYPPGPGLMLAAGQVLTGSPIVGSWLMTSACCAAFYWLLLGFLPSRWALLGGLILVLHPNVQVSMGQSFFGANLAFLSGTLVCGAVPRLQRSFSSSAAALMACGAVGLAGSRPYEGAVLCVCCGIWVGAAWAKQKPLLWRKMVIRVALPFAAILLAGLVGIATFNKAVTGKATLLPYQVHENTYGVCPLFAWQSPGADREYPHPIFNEYHEGWSMDWYDQQQSVGGFIQAKWEMIRDAWIFYLPLPLAFVAGIFFVVRRSAMKPVVAVCAVMFVAAGIAVFSSHRYLAPVAPLFVLLFVEGVRLFCVLVRRRIRGFHPAGILLGLLLLKLGLEAVHAGSTESYKFGQQRAELVRTLEAKPGRHVVLVEYGAGHKVRDEWVYNGADIDASPVVWARSLNAAADERLISYFHDRTVWRFNPESAPPKLMPATVAETRAD